MKAPRLRPIAIGLLAALAFSAVTTYALTLLTQTWEFNEAATLYTRSSSAQVDLYSTTGTGQARLIKNIYTHTRNTLPGNALVLTTPAATRTATATTVDTTATEGFTGTLTDLSWMTDHLETTPPAQVPAATAGLTALYHLDEGTGTTAVDSRGGLNLTLCTTGTTWTLPGQMGAAALAGCATRTTAPQVNVTNWTLEAWVNLTSPPPGGVTAYGTSPVYLGQWVTMTGGGYGLWISSGQQLGVIYQPTVAGGPCLTGCAISDSKNFIPLNQWTHIAVTRDAAGVATAYINGVQLPGDVDGLGIPGGILPMFRIGMSPTGFGTWIPFSDGSVDEVAVYNRVLPVAELQSHVLRKMKGTYLSNAVDASRTQTANPPSTTTNPLIQMWRPLSWTESPASIGNEPSSTAGLTALWKMEDTGTTATDAVAGINGALNGAAKWAPGRLGAGAVWLDGISSINIPDNAAALGTTNATVEAWVRPDVLAAGPIYNRQTSAGIGGVSLELGASGEVIFKRYTGGAWQTVSSPTNTVAVGSWYHVAGTYDGTSQLVYVNGAQKGSLASSGATNNPAGALVRIGQNIFSTAQALKGAVDAVAVYNRALAPSELMDHYTAGKTSLLFKAQTSTNNATWSALLPSAQLLNATPGLAILWHFDERTGVATTVDSTGGTNTVADTAQLGMDQNPVGDISDPTWETVNQKLGASALKFNGSSAFATSAGAATAGPQVFSIEAWFKAPAGTTGTLIGFGGNAQPSSTEALRDRLVYLNSVGQLAFGVAPGGVKHTVTTTSTYTDNQWHHVAAVQSPFGMFLYVDGALQGQDLTATSAQAMTGYWHLGYEDLTGWPSPPAQPHFGGWLDEVAIYSVPLDAGTVAKRVEESFQGLSDAAGASLSGLPNGRYLQVKAYLSTEDQSVSPKLLTLAANAYNYPLQTGTYPQDWPSISNYVSSGAIAPAYTILGMNGFRATPLGTGTARYQFSRDGTTWYCYQTNAWLVVNPAAPTACGGTPYNTLATLQANFDSFASTIGPGNTYWRAFLLSPTGSEDAGLDQVQADYATGSFTMTAPTLNNTWLAGQSKTITWNTTGTIGTVKIEYSPLGTFSDSVVLADPATNGPNSGCTASAGTGCYVWAIPSNVTVSANSHPGQGASKIRVSGADVGTTYVTGTSAVFTVSRLDVTAPLLNETKLLGLTYPVTWNTSATDPTKTVTLEYSQDDGTTWSTLPGAGALPSTPTSFSWTVDPTTPVSTTPGNSNPGQGKSLLRISYTAAPTEFRSSPNFTVSRLGLTAPVANETRLLGLVYPITWDTSAAASALISLTYSPDNGTTWSAIPGATSISNNGNFSWTVDPATAVSSAPGSPNPLQGKSLVRISYDAAATEVKDSPNFTVTKLQLTGPTSADTWLVGNIYAVTWATTASAGELVKLEYSPDSGTSWQTIPGGASAPNTGTFSWTVDPTTPVSTTPGNSNPGQGKSLIRVSFVNDSAAKNLSQPFTMTQFAVTSPAQSDLWRLGKIHSVAWTTTAPGLSSIKIDYSPSGTFTDALPVVASAPSAGGASSYAWTLPVNLAYLSTATDTGRIRVAGLNGLGALVNDSAGFTITRPFIQITTPSTGQVVAVLTAQPITWIKQGTIGDRLKFEYSTNGFADETQNVCFLNCGAPASAIPTFSPYSWVVPEAAASPNVKLRLSDLIIPEGFGVSESFKVAGGLAVTFPRLDQTWAVGKTHTIQWNSDGQINSVKLLLSKDGGNGFPTVISLSATNGSGGGNFTWTPQPGDVSTTAVIRVEDAADPQVFGVSPVFRVTAVAVTSPAAGDQWLVGSAQAITWTHTGLNNVRIEYSTDTGNTFPNLITASTPAGSGSFNWTVADTVKKDAVMIRLQDADLAGESQAEGLSAALTIYGQMALTSPVGGELWGSGQSHEVRWTTPVGTIPNVKLEYSIDGFICLPTSNCGVIAASVANTGSYMWTPSFTSTTAKVRVSDAQNAQTNSDSPGYFQVTGIAILEPLGGEGWTVGSTKKMIRWNYTGSFDFMKLEYSTDDFNTATLIVDGAPNFKSYEWATVPDAISSNVKIRITPVGYPALYSISNPLTIQGVLQLTAPNGGETFDVASPQQIRWNATGSMPTVKLQLSTNSGTGWSDIATVNGALGGGTSPVANAYAWTIPDAISSQARVRVVDAVVGHPASNDDSNANFTIRAALATLSPVGADAWAVNEAHQIRWTTVGSVATVIFEYSVGGGPFTPFGVANNCATPDGLTACSLNWMVPNLVPTPQASPAVSVVVRVKDATPAHPAASADSPAFTVKWYKITWNVLDSNNNNHLNGLNVQDDPLPASFWPGWLVTDGSLASSAAGTLFRYYPSGTFNTAWSKTGYFSGSASGWAADSDKVITVYLESETADQVEFHVHAESAYDPATDTLSFKTWLEKRGLLVGTTAADLFRLGGSTIEVYDGTTLLMTLTDPVPDSKGQYEFTWPATGLTGGKVYFATASVIFPNQPVPGVTRTSGGVVNITIPKQIDAIQTTTGSNGVTLTQMQTELQPISAAVVGDATTPPTLQTAIQTDTQAAVSSSEGVITQAVGGVQTTANDISTATVGQNSTLEKVKTDTAAISTATVGATSALETVKTDTGQIKSDVQMVLVPQANATKADTAAIKAATVGVDSTLEQVKVDTVAIKADTADMRPKVSAILSDPNVGLPKVQQMITDQTTTMQDQFKSMRRGAIMTRDGAVEKGETPTISYRSEGGSPTVDVYNAISGARVLGPVPMPLNPATGLYDFAMDTTALPGGEYKVMVNEPSSPTSGGTIDSITMTVRDPALRTAQNTSDVAQAITALDAKVTTVLSQLDTLAKKADSIQVTTSATKTTTDQLAVDVKTLTDGWGTQTLAQVTEQLGALSAKVGSPSQAADVNTLVSQLTGLQELVQSSQGSAASVGYAQNAMAAAMESVELIKQVQQTLGASALPPTAPAQLAQLQESLTRIAQVISALPEKVASEDMGQQVAQLTEQIKALASEKGYAFDSLYEMSADQTKDVKAVRNRVEELKAVLDVQQSILENRVNEPVVKTWFESTY